MNKLQKKSLKEESKSLIKKYFELKEILISYLLDTSIHLKTTQKRRLHYMNFQVTVNKLVCDI